MKFTVAEAVKSYVRRINITGNTRTLDKVVRRELSILEGDPFNGQNLKNSINALKRLGYFKSVDVNILKTGTPGVVDIEIKVVENLTKLSNRQLFELYKEMKEVIQHNSDLIQNYNIKEVLINRILK